MGLAGMIADMVQRCDIDLTRYAPLRSTPWRGDRRALAQLITALENGKADPELVSARAQAKAIAVPVLGITGTGGAGKSSLTDELIRRFRLDQGDALSIAVISIDPSRRKSGGALLGDRIRMNAINHPNVFMRSLATREAGSEIPGAARRHRRLQGGGFDLVIVRPPASARATRPSCRTSTCRCT
jgi:methylmalonyl-CoA mutase